MPDTFFVGDHRNMFPLPPTYEHVEEDAASQPSAKVSNASARGPRRTDPDDGARLRKGQRQPRSHPEPGAGYRQPQTGPVSKQRGPSAALTQHQQQQQQQQQLNTAIASTFAALGQQTRDRVVQLAASLTQGFQHPTMLPMMQAHAGCTIPFVQTNYLIPDGLTFPQALLPAMSPVGAPLAMGFLTHPCTSNVVCFELVVLCS